MSYTIHVCPFCGAQGERDNDYETGSGWEFDCEHLTYSDEYGSVEPLTIEVEAPGVAAAVEAARPGLEVQRRERAFEKADRAAREAKRRASLTPEQREAEDRRNEAMTSVLRDLSASMARQMSERSPLLDWYDGQ